MKINIEIQRVRHYDEIFRALFYMGKLTSDIEEGKKKLEYNTLISLWVCDFNPIRGVGIPVLPYYTFIPKYEPVKGIIGSDEAFSLGNGEKYIFVNGEYDWSIIEKERALTAKEKAIKE